MKRIAAIASVVGLLTALAIPTAAVFAQPTNDLLTDIPVTGSLSDGGTFEGILDLTEIAIEEGQLVVSGVLEGTATDGAGTVTEITQTFSGVAIGDLLGGGSSAGKCDILFLDLGPLHLDLLGLEVDLSQVTLDVNAIPGAGNLLGNLLCSVAGLLDRGGPLSAIENLLDRIAGILGG